MQKIVLFLTLCMPFNSPRQTADTALVSVNKKFVATQKTFIYTLGNRQIPIKTLKYGKNKDIVMISLHDDETTGVEAAKKVLEKTGGFLIKIENNNERYITFSHKGKTLRFDPNRIFTRTGIRSTLLEQNNYGTDATIKAVDGFAKFLLRKIPPTRTLIALHNNDDDGLSVITYMQGGHHEKDVVTVNKNEAHDPDNFFLTTDQRLFRSLRSAGYNVIFQNNKKAKDDGSLSINYGRRRKSYVNIEAKTGMIRMQEKMIETVMRMIERKAEKK